MAARRLSRSELSTVTPLTGWGAIRRICSTCQRAHWRPARPENPTPKEHAIKGLDSFDACILSILIAQATSLPRSCAERAGEHVSPAWTLVILSAWSGIERESLPHATAHARRPPPRKTSVVLWASVARASSVMTSHTALVRRHVMDITTSTLIASWGRL
jgi:hypothetical protein